MSGIADDSGNNLKKSKGLPSEDLNDGSGKSEETKKVGSGGKGVRKAADIEETQGEVNMEASITSDDVIRAGGLGARDDISSFLPVAIDSTDFEASLRDAREYEEPQGQVCRPGLGWPDVNTKSE